MRRILWGGLGGVAVGLGAAGAVLPLVPTTPFMLLAAFCLARASPRLEHWLVEHPRFGPSIRDWRSHRAIAPRAKRLALLAIAASFGISLLMGVRPAILTVQAAVLAGVALFILTRPSGPRIPRA